MKLEEIDLLSGDDHTHPQICTQNKYLCIIAGAYLVGQFEKVNRGLLFHNAHDSAILYDKPGINNSRWNKVYKINESEKIEIGSEKHRASKKTVKTSCGKVVLKYKSKL